MSSVLDAASNLADAYPGGAAALAGRIEKKPFTLMHELAGTGTAKLGLDTAVLMSKRSRDLRILNAFAAEMGCAAPLLLPEALALEDDDAMHLVSKLASEFNDVVQSFVSAMADGKVTGNEVAGIRKQWAELQLVGQRLVSFTEAAHEAAKPPHIRSAT